MHFQSFCRYEKKLKNYFLLGAAIIAACSCKPGRPVSASGLTAFDPTLVSSHATPDPATVACFGDQARQPEQIREYEPHAAVNPENPDQMVAVWMAHTETAYIIEASRSEDGGRTWSSPFALPFSECAEGPEGAMGAGDPWVTFGLDNRVYAGSLGVAMNAEGTGFSYSAILVSTSADGGRNWGPARVVAPSEFPLYFYDNLTLTADPVRPGIVYLSSTQYQNTEKGQPIKLENTMAGPAAVARSTDGGQTWTPMVPVSEVKGGDRISAPLAVIDPRSGRVYLIYFRERDENARLGVQVSDDQGETWSQERIITKFIRLKEEPGTTIKFGGKYPITTAQDIIQGVVDPVSGRIYVAFADGRHTQGRFLSVSLTSSADGLDWTDPEEVNPPMEAHAWLPSVAVDGEGRLGVSYLDVSKWQEDNQTTVPTQLVLAVYPLESDGLPGTRVDYLIDSFNLIGGPGKGRGGTGDYQALLGLKRGFVPVYVKNNCGPMSSDCGDEEHGATDVYIVLVQ